MTVTDYEDREDINSGNYTVYVVTVLSTATGHEWKLYKRYNEFANLYNAVSAEYNLENFPAFEDYRFPNKSLFNTFSDFTKIRRRDGFHDLLQRIQQSKFPRMPAAMMDFFDLANNHSRDWSRMREKAGDGSKSKKISPYEFMLTEGDHKIVNQHMKVELPWIVYKMSIIVITAKFGMLYLGIQLVGFQLERQLLLFILLVFGFSFLKYRFRRREVEVEILMAKDGSCGNGDDDGDDNGSSSNGNNNQSGNVGDDENDGNSNVNEDALHQPVGVIETDHAHDTTVAIS